MSIKRGVVATYVSNAARPISIISTIPIAIVVTSATQLSVGLHGYDGLKDALLDMEAKSVTSVDGTALKYLKLGELYNATAPIVLSVMQEGVDNAGTKANVLTAIDLIKSAPSLTGYKPDIIIAPDFAFDVDIGNALISVSEKFAGRCFIDLNATTNAEAITRRNAFGSDRLTPIKTSGIANGIEYDGAALMAWARVVRDGDVDGLGWSRSISNFILPISSVKSPSDFIMGQGDDTDDLTVNQITSMIFHKGFRSWEYSTCSVDAMWQDARRIRIFDKASEAVIEGVFYAIDKGISELRSAKKSLRSFMADLVGQEIMLGFEVRLDTERTTATAITKGEFYFIIDAQEMPSPRLIMVTFNRVDKYTPVLYEILAAA